MDVFLDYGWKGNVRELQHMIERLVVTAEGNFIGASDLPRNMFGFTLSHESAQAQRPHDYRGQMEQYEGMIVRDAYEKYGSSRKMAACLQISQTKVNSLIQRYVSSSH